jgi:hypothetical protein
LGLELSSFSELQHLDLELEFGQEQKQITNAEEMQLLREERNENIPTAEWSKLDKQLLREEQSEWIAAQTTEISEEPEQVFYDPGLTRKEQLQLRREEMEAARGEVEEERQNFVEEMIQDISCDEDEDDEDDDW